MESDRHLGPITWPAWLYVLVFYVLPMTLDLVIYAGDLVTDLRVAHLHYLNDSPSWGFWTVFFVFLPAILCFVVCVYRLFSKHSDEVPYVLKWMAIYIVCVFFFPLYPIFRYLRVLPYALMAMCSDRNREENLLQCKEPSQAKTFRFLEAFLESTPQFILQAIILLKSKESNLILETTQLQAMIFSLLSIAMTVITYEQDAKEEGRALTKHKVLPQEKKRKDPWQSETPEEHEEREVVAEEARVNLLEKVLRFIAWLLLLTGRLFALALFASIFYYYFFVLAAVHMIAVTVYLVLKTPVDLDFKTIIIFIFFSFISLFTFIQYKVDFSVLVTREWILFVVYFSVNLLENLAIVIGWYGSASSTLWYHTLGLAGSLSSYVIGIVLLWASHFIGRCMDSRPKTMEMKSYDRGN